MKKTIILLFASVQISFSQGASPLLSGPMQGYLEMKETVIWLQTKGISKVYAHYDDLDTPVEDWIQTNSVMTREEDGFVAKLYFRNLEPGHSYSYKIFINDVQVERPYAFKFTTPELFHKMKKMPDFRLALASCMYVNDEAYDAEGSSYGGEYEILDEIVKQDPEAMLWLGDHVYLRPTDWTSKSGYISRYTKTRSLPQLQQLLATCPHYAIWDDHEYGPNDANGSWIMKETALEVFELFWNNKSYGYPDLPGIMTGFQMHDISVIMLDNRYNRTEQMQNGKEQILGMKQIDHLINLLKFSNSPYKLVAVGGQVLNTAKVYENHANYEEERNYLLRRIEEEEIKGVVFLTGDRHHSEVMKYEGKNGIDIWEFTTSPLTSGTHTKSDENNELRVPGSLISKRNFSILSVSGPYGDRSLEINYYSSDGKKLYSYQIEASELD